ncbi:MAG: hypothetical protein V1837_02500 [Candidatus Woesearchaeota archaeon]
MIEAAQADEVAILREHFRLLRERLSQNRKLGMDTKIADLKLMSVAPKIQMAAITSERRDLEVVQRLLSEIESEMKQLRKEQRFEDVLSKVAVEERERLDKSESPVEYLKLSQDEIIDKTNKLINQAIEFLDKAEFEKVYPIYVEIQGIYKYLPKDLKQEVFTQAILIYRRLRTSDIFKKKSRLQLLVKKVKWRFGL